MMGTHGKINAIWWLKLAEICGYELPTNQQNFIQKDLTEASFRGYFFLRHPVEPNKPAITEHIPHLHLPISRTASSKRHLHMWQYLLECDVRSRLAGLGSSASSSASSLCFLHTTYTFCDIHTLTHNGFPVCYSLVHKRYPKKPFGDYLTFFLNIRFWYLRCCGCPWNRGRQHLAMPLKTCHNTEAGFLKGWLLCLSPNSEVTASETPPFPHLGSVPAVVPAEGGSSA